MDKLKYFLNAIESIPLVEIIKSSHIKALSIIVGMQVLYSISAGASSF